MCVPRFQSILFSFAPCWHSIINNTHAIKGWNFNFRALPSYAHILCLIKTLARDVIIYAKYFDCGWSKSDKNYHNAIADKFEFFHKLYRKSNVPKIQCKNILSGKD